MKNIVISSDEEKRIKEEIGKRSDPESQRLARFLAMPDLTRTENSPLHEIAQRVIALPDFADFYVIEDPEIVRADISFDLFDFAQDHPARSKSDTYYLDDQHILRTHTTIMWYYLLIQEEVKKKIAAGQNIGSLSYGKVYRKDEIDRNHMNVFHQIDGWYLCPRSVKEITKDDLQDVLVKIAKAIYGEDIKYRFNEDTFPYTNPSIEMEIDKDGKWLEVLGAGVVKGVVLKNLGVDPEVYNGWAFGFGLERLAMISMELPDIRLLWSDDERVKKQLVLGNKFREVSKFPPITRDISFVVDKDFTPNNYYDLVRDLGGGLVEEVKLLDNYDNEKFGAGKTSYTFRIVYRSNERTLVSEEIDAIQDKICEDTKNQFKAEIR
ncbi:MAG: hypothetical protein A2568_02700 [Candidatus Yanofskybacteria bacterium RIFOXYD1_FULL_44_17]|uniref:phenylalanine--tRNA ligase n=1 Tax=Candidatus Yanofskybacteria bacterium GW2011_GWE2_40_11 TaxID=1619033 RepID=A0A0G0TSS1_9BACT|nr:MAG: hypothetical protein UT69_C0019G0004 [Candidatus Yanofskybacteria bacterium GW2011_GWE1_40_10]KKR40922.1 MAG: hypothetical protein UT75_C0003G0052 [Candidatus Yanofskybacteria bacterium GW2011_GWE2_40_11]KKT15405.1 MAG: hypothetical protein UV97_C0007G0015 [Candidatus Yanofskybacteria bacterium GW2011_GWF2_43_596]OGN35381.1 MAG: hypothetical protein A2207_00100 [Candidatus Yanofskybacteria bacterium RIFOXYA1_FULL_44_17]OGN36529.1 MAG: hypothetical protein A2241_02205 [Candidatus Yanofsk